TTRLRRPQKMPSVDRHIRVHREPASRVVTIAIRPSAIEAGCADNTANPNFWKVENFRDEGLTRIRGAGGHACALPTPRDVSAFKAPCTRPSPDRSSRRAGVSK